MKSLFTVAIVVMLSWTWRAGADGAPASQPDRLETQITALLDAAVAKRIAPGISVAIARQGKAPIIVARGSADLSAKQSTTPATVFRIGSVTKQFTAAGVMLLAEQSKLSLDDAIERYVAVPDVMRGITLRQLLSQRSG